MIEFFEAPFKLTAEYFDITYKNSVYFSIKHQNTDRYKLEKKNKFIDEINPVENKLPKLKL